jgi:hypothetical protein
MCWCGSLVRHRARAVAVTRLSASVVTRDRKEIAVAAIGADAVMLGRLLRQRHASHATGRLRTDGVLMDRCAICDTKIDAQWLSRPDRSAQRQRGVSPRQRPAGVRLTAHHAMRDLACDQARKRSVGPTRTRVRPSRRQPAMTSLEPAPENYRRGDRVLVQRDPGLAAAAATIVAESTACPHLVKVTYEHSRTGAWIARRRIVVYARARIDGTALAEAPLS